MKHLMVLVMVLATLGLGAGLAVSAEKEKAAAPVNSKCPVGGREAKASKTVVYKGETVALCCNKCMAKFEADPEKYAKNIERDLKKQYTEGSCCDKAAKKGETCKHPCCVAAEKEGKVCTKCNKPAKEYAEGSCCDKADKKGETCKHPCCVAAEKEGNVCTKCNKPKKENK